ncbi:NAD-dependent epimerase/dehydratase family protein [Egicoccus sp. AB-alg2]|uniref:NAD-dependent epimerase/dehydratase family protein n=1 Tax=Egicoccus sp. AB-alg2 TaxID=3242693 RepID=UPI00359E1F71
MRVLVTGATGALGRPMVGLLAASGHEVLAVARRFRDLPVPSNVIEAAVDVLDADAVSRFVRQQRPEAIVHFATAIPPQIDPKRIGRQFETTNRLRTDGTRNLLRAAEQAGIETFLAQGLAYAYEPGDTIRTEADPLWPAPPAPYAPVADALKEMERLVADAGGVVLRLGHLYGPGTIYAADGSMTRMVSAGKVPIVGAGAARYSFVHVDDVASAVLAALDLPAGGGTFNVVDDHPLYLHDWLPWFAKQLGAKPPKRFPVALARLAVGPFGVAFMNQLAGASNARAREVLDWRPQFPSFREGVVAERRGITSDAA